MATGEGVEPERAEPGSGTDAILIARLVRDASGTVVDAVIEFANDAWRADFGIDEPELPGKRLLAVVPAAAERLETYAQTVDAGRSVRRIAPMPGDSSRRFAVQYDPYGESVVVVAHEVTREAALELALRESEAHYRAVAETAADAIITADDEGLIVAWNSAATRMFGYEAAEALRQPIEMIMPPGLGPVHGQRLRGLRVSAGQDDHGPRTIEVPARRRDGIEFPVEIALSEAWAAGEHLTTAIIRDITERRAAAVALAASEGRFRAMFEEAPLGVALVNSVTGEFHEINERFAAILGRTRAEMGTIDWMSVTHPDDLAPDLAQMARFNRAEIDGYRMEKRYLRPDGSVIWTIITIARVKASEPSQPRHLCMIDDISERKEAEAALERSRTQLADAQRIAHVGSWTLDLATRTTTWSDELLRIFGQERSDGAPDVRDLERRYGADSAAALRHAITHTVRTAEPFEVPLTLRRPDAAPRHVIARGEAAFGPGGAVVSLLGTVADVTELHDAQETVEQARLRLDEAQRIEMVGQLAAGIAHDFNNLLMAINGYADVLSSGLTPSDPAQGDVLAIRDAGRRAAELTHQLLAFGRRQTLHPSVLDLAAVVASLAPMLRSLVGDQVDVVLTSPDNAGLVLVDRTLVERVVVNLVLNARDAMPHGGTVTLGVRAVIVRPGDARLGPHAAPGPYLCLSVADTGTGIAPDVLAHIFEPFFTTKGPGRGSGLGLSSVDGAVAQSGGVVSVQTQHGLGSVFEILLPQVDASSQPALPPPVREAAEPHTATILVVDDEPAVLAIATRLLRASGHTVYAAAGPELALDIVREGHPIDLLLTDVMMPGANGRVLAERVQTMRPGVAVVYMSGFSPETIFADGVLKQGAAFLTKPFTITELTTSLRVALSTAAPGS